MRCRYQRPRRSSRGVPLLASWSELAKVTLLLTLQRRTVYARD